MTSKQELRKEITQLIDNIKEHSDNLTGKERLPQLELELILFKIEKLYQKSIVFNFIHQYSTPGELSPAEEENAAAEAASFINSGAINPVKPQLTEQNSDINAEQVAIDLNTRHKRSDKEALHEKIAVKEDFSLAGKMQKSKISSLEKATGLNERILFIKELFGGNPNDYAEAVKKLDNLSSFSEAQDFITEVQERYKWQENNPAVVKFNELITRRFIN